VTSAILIGALMLLSEPHAWYQETIVRKIQYARVNTFSWPMFRTSVHMHSWGELLHSPKLLTIFFQQQFHYALPFVLLFLFAYRLIRNHMAWLIEDARALMAIGSLGMWGGMLYHCAHCKFLSIIPVVGFGVAVLLSCAVVAHRKTWAWSAFLCCLPLLFFAKNAAGAIADWRAASSSISTGMLGSVRFPDRDRRKSVLKLRAFLQERGIKQAFSNNALVYPLCDLKNPTRYNVLFSTTNGPADIARIENDLRQTETRYVILGPGEEVLGMDSWLEEKYSHVKTFGPFKVYRTAARRE
jgi:hypothetical protein